MDNAANTVGRLTLSAAGAVDVLNHTLDEGSYIKVELAPDHQVQWGDVFNLLDWIASSLNLNADGIGNGFTLDHLILPTNLGNGGASRPTSFWNMVSFTSPRSPHAGSCS